MFVPAVPVTNANEIIIANINSLGIFILKDMCRSVYIYIFSSILVLLRCSDREDKLMGLRTNNQVVSHITLS